MCKQCGANNATKTTNSINLQRRSSNPTYSLPTAESRHHTYMWKECLLLCFVSDERCLGFSFCSLAVGLLLGWDFGGFDCAIGVVVLGNARHLSVLNREVRTSPETPRAHNNDPPSRGKLQAAVDT